MAARSRRKAAPLPEIPRLENDAPPPPSGALINVILEYADIQHDAGDGRRVLRLSARRMKDPVIRAQLGRETRRLADISLIWDEDEGEIVRVHDAAASEPCELVEDCWAQDSFELTEAALAYIEAHKGRRPVRAH